MTRVHDAERRARLVVRHQLAEEARAASAVEVARALVALHATGPAAVFLSIRARMDEVAVDEIERALYSERALIRIQAITGLLFATFLVLHLVNTMLAAAGQSVYDGWQHECWVKVRKGMLLLCTQKEG